MDYLRIAAGVVYCDNYVMEVIYDCNFWPEFSVQNTPDNKVHGANMEPIWGRQGPGGPHQPCYLGRTVYPDNYSDMIYFITKVVSAL